MRKRVIAIAAALLMMLTLLTACSTDTTDNESTTAPTEKVTTEAADTETTETEATKNPNTCPYEGDTVTWDVFSIDVGMEEDENSPVFQIYKKAIGNIELNWELVPWADWETKVNIYLSSGEIPDIMFCYSDTIAVDYGDSGLFLDLNQYADVMPNWTAAADANPALRTYETENGEQFTMENLDCDYPGETWYANKTMLDELGIAIPTTLTELEAAMQQVLDADSTVTPFHTIWNIDYYMKIFATTINAQIDWYYDDTAGTWKFPLTSPESKYEELVTMLADYYEKGYFNAEFATMSTDQTIQLMTSNKWAFTVCYTSSPDVEWYKIDTNESFPIDIEPMLPVAAEGVTPNFWFSFSSDNPTWCYAASVDIENPELVASFFDTLISDEVSIAYYWGVEDVSYTVDPDTGKLSWIPEFLEGGNEARAELGYVLATRFLTKAHIDASLQRVHPTAQKAVTMLVDAVEAGTIETYYPRKEPRFTADESDELSALMTTVETLIQEGAAQFILGQRSLDEWDDFVAEITAAGDIDRAVEIYNNAIQQPDRITSEQRTYSRP